MSLPSFSFVIDPQHPAIFEIGAVAESGQPKWPSIWRKDFREWVALQLSQETLRVDWFHEIDKVLVALARPVIVVCRGPFCEEFAAWVDSRPAEALGSIEGALLIAPTLSSQREFLSALTGEKTAGFPFPSVVIASHDSRMALFEQMRRAARHFGSRLVDGGDIGDAGEAPELGDWLHGRHVLDWLIEQTVERRRLAILRDPRRRSSCPDVQS